MLGGRTLIRPPESRIGPVTDEERHSVIDYSPVYDKYTEPVDRESAAEILAKRMDSAQADAEGSGSGGGWGDVIFGGNPSAGTGKGRQPAGMGEMIGKELKRTIARKVATTIKDIIVGSIKGGRR